ncbi:hypothetical protein FD754_006854, partial [Muntiacus muntjak]
SCLSPEAGGGCGSQFCPQGCLGRADLCIMTRLLGYVDLSEPHFVAAVLAIVFNPLFWNVEPTASEPGGRPLGESPWGWACPRCLWDLPHSGQTHPCARWGRR